MSFLDGYSGQKFLASYGISGPKQHLATSAEQASAAAMRIGFPVVMKIAAQELVHKSNKGLIVTGIPDAAAAKAAFMGIMTRAKGIPADGVVVQETAHGNELIAGARHDGQFGPIILVGSGGILTEIVKDIQIGICPLSKAQLRGLVEKLKLYPVLQGARGTVSDIDEIIKVLDGLQRMLKKVQEVEINPLLCGKKAIAVDARVIL